MNEEQIYRKAISFDDPKQRAAFLVEQGQEDNDQLLARIRQHLDSNFDETRKSTDGINRADSLTDGFESAATDDETTAFGLVAGQMLNDHYKLLEPIGEGGMGSIWLAEQKEPVRRSVAIKVIKSGHNSREIIRRFEAERQALAIMDHPNIARVFDAGTTASGLPFFVMELVKGVPITRYCDKKKLSPRQRMALFVPVCHALQHAHQKGIIHRDIKPSNILVAEFDNKPVPKVIDFGVAKATGQPLTEQTLATGYGNLVGTPQYMSPEQATLDTTDIDTRSDVYSLGVLLYELLTGSTPVDTKSMEKPTVMEVLRCVREVDPPRPSDRVSSSNALPSISASRKIEPKKLTGMLRKELDWIILKALEKDRNRRYESASAFAADIERYMYGEPVQAHPPTLGYRIQKFVSKNRGFVVAASLVALALIAGFIGTSIGLFEATRQKEIAQGEAEEKEKARKRAVAAESETRKSLERMTAAKEEAAREAAVAMAINDFTRNAIFGQADSRNQANDNYLPDPELRMRTALDRAAEQIGDYFKDQPAVEAAIQQTIGNAYFGVGEFDKSVVHLQRAHDLLVEVTDSNDLKDFKVLNDLALAHDAAGNSKTAIEMLEKCCDEFESRLGKTNEHTLAAYNNLAVAYRSTKNPREAIKVLEEISNICREQLGDDSIQSLAAMNNLGLSYKAAGQTSRAIKIFNEILELADGSMGPEHPNTLSTYYHLADAYVMTRNIPKAIEAFEKSAFGRKKVLGRDHPYTLKAMNNLGALYWRTKQLKKSVPMFQELAEVHEEKFGRDDIGTVSVVANLAVNLADSGDIDKAIPLMEETYRMSDKYIHVKWMGLRLISAYCDSGKTKKLDELATKVADDFKVLSNSNQMALADNLSVNGKKLIKEEQWKHAEQLFRHGFEIRGRLDPASWTTGDTLSDLGECLRHQENKKQAEEKLLRAAELLGQSSERKAKRCLETTRSRLAALYTDLGNEEEAKKWTD